MGDAVVILKMYFQTYLAYCYHFLGNCYHVNATKPVHDTSTMVQMMAWRRPVISPDKYS